MARRGRLHPFKPKKGLNEDDDPGHVPDEGRARVDARLPAQGLPAVPPRPIPPGAAAALLDDIDFDDIYYYIKPAGTQVKDWDMVPESIKHTYEKLGIPEAERKYLAGVTAQYESEVVYHRNREDLERLGVLFSDMDTALREYPDLVKEYFARSSRPTTTSSPP